MRTLLTLAAFGLLACGSPDASTDTSTETADTPTLPTTPTMQTIKFNADGNTLVGNLHLPAGFDESETYPAVVVDGSWTTVKEQMQGLYANALAEEGYIALAFDHRYYGESEGSPREFENHNAKVADIKAAVTYLQSLPYVANDRIGGLGVCASGAYMMQATAEDDRIRAYAGVVPWLMTPETAKLFYGGDEGTQDRIAKANAAEQKRESSGDIEYVPAYDPDNKEAAMFFPVEYYAKESRGNVPAWNNNFAVESWKYWLTYDGVESSKNVDVPAVIVGSDKQFLPEGAKAALDNFQGPTEMVWLSEYEHDQFYDSPEVIAQAVAGVETFFDAHL